MSTCKVCDGPLNPALVICAYCGTTSGQIDDAADERAVLRDLSSAAQRIASERAPDTEEKGMSTGAILLCIAFWPIGIFVLLARAQTKKYDEEKLRRLSSFWQNAFIPAHVDVQGEAALQATAMVVQTLDARDMLILIKSPRTIANEIYLKRAETILASMRLNAGTSGDAGRRMQTVQTEIAKARTACERSLHKSHVIGGVIFALAVIMYTIIALT